MKSFKLVINLKEDSAAEKYFMRGIIPYLKDRPIVRLGAIWGFDGVNQYEISLKDRIRLRREISVLKRLMGV